MISIAWIALAACGGGTSSSTQPAQPTTTAAPAPAPGPGGDASCQQAIEAMFAVTAANEAPELRARSAKVFVHRCEADRWSVELRRCMAEVKQPEEADACEKMLTPEQTRDLADELSKELDAAGVKPETRSGRPKAREREQGEMKKEKAKAKAKAPGGVSDPCEGGE
jgi:hypothetical protein